MREIVHWNRDWFFHKGDIKQEKPGNKGFAYISAKTERRHTGPACKDYWISLDGNSYRLDKDHNNDIWETVHLPHDYMLDAPISKEENQALGFCRYENGWYIKRFRLENSDRNKRLTVFFEGIASQATVWLNGCLLKHSFSGYTPFEVDISDTVKFDAENTLAIYVSTEEHEGWWYEGGGIWRNVELVKTELFSIDRWGLYARPVPHRDGNWSVETEVTLRNDSYRTGAVTLEAELLSPDGTVIAASRFGGKIPDRETRVLKDSSLSVVSPALWSPDTPVQYTLRVHLYHGKEQVDEQSVRFGFRTYTVDPARGLFINGKHYKLKGVCGHVTCGLFGKAIPDNIYRHRVKLYREMGVNAYRTSHYPQPIALMDALDAAGIVVMNETRWFESTEEGKAQLEALIKRDRNRPGVFFWSVGNEEAHHTTDEGRRINRALISVVKKLDPDRLVMCASDRPDAQTVFDDCDIIGINYNLAAYDRIHERYPDKGVMSSECCASGTTRGWYFPPDPNRAYMSAYDRDFNNYFLGREKTWRFFAERDYLLGAFQWHSIDYRGEATWPRLCSQSGAIDMFYQKKDAFWQNRSHWSEEPMVHLLPHWNWKGLEGEDILVVAYTNLPRVELFLNGESLGVCELERYGHGEWTVPYRPGRLEARAYDADGVCIATDSHITSGAPHALKLRLENTDICANGSDAALITCYAVDEDGNEVPDAACEVSFHVSGAGTLHATGSDISDHTSPYSSTRKMYAGRISVAVRSTPAPGTFSLYASSPTLAQAVLHVTIE